MRAIIFIILLFYCLVITDAQQCTTTVYKSRPHTVTTQLYVVTGPLFTDTVRTVSVKTTDLFSTIRTTFTPIPTVVTATSTLTSMITLTSTDVTVTSEDITLLIPTTKTITNTTTIYTMSYSYPNKKRSPPDLRRRQICKTVTSYIDFTDTTTQTVDIASGTTMTTVTATTTATDTVLTTTTISLSTSTATTTTVATTTAETEVDTTITVTTGNISFSTYTTTATTMTTQIVDNYPFCDPSKYRFGSLATISSPSSIQSAVVSTPDHCCYLCGNTRGCAAWVLENDDCYYYVLNNPQQCGTVEVTINGTEGLIGVTPCATFN